VVIVCVGRYHVGGGTALAVSIAALAAGIAPHARRLWAWRPLLPRRHEL